MDAERTLIMASIPLIHHDTWTYIHKYVNNTELGKEKKIPLWPSSILLSSQSHTINNTGLFWVFIYVSVHRDKILQKYRKQKNTINT
jgi:hypothetical protein